MQLRTLCWIGDTAGKLRLIDQTLLPVECRQIDCETSEQVREAIRSLRVRGAPAIGVAAAYGVVLGLQEFSADDRKQFNKRLQQVVDDLASSRPTAVNLFWALDRMQKLADSVPELPSGKMLKRLLSEAEQIEKEDRDMCAAIGRFGAELLSDNQGILTHCNAGGLATAGDGTALSVIFEAATLGKKVHVYVDETRPLLQGARLTTWELSQRKIPVTLICDSTAGWVMKEGKVSAVITGADRIAANGDAANKIGTYSVALLAQAHQIPFYVAAPSSTFDLSLTGGNEIPIELRSAQEITHGFQTQTVPDDVDIYNPAFDVTPAEYIATIITERGLIQPVNAETIKKILQVT